jgi:acylphosphatase
VAISFRVQGRVQGVGFRHFTLVQARQLNLTGWVRNDPDGCVSGEAFGSAEALQAFETLLRQGPAYAHVTQLDVSPIDNANQSYDDFQVTY